VRSNSFLHIFICFFLFVFVWVDDAQAYIDAGTASLLFQSLVAAIVGGLFLIKTYWDKLKNFFSRKKDFQSDLEKNLGDK
jgi:O-antigen/teichoic acid export membrane protein